MDFVENIDQTDGTAEDHLNNFDIANITDESIDNPESGIKCENIKISHLNVNGWTSANHELRNEIVNGLNSDIIGISETHLQGNDDITVTGFKWMGKNRQSTKLKGSGGVGILFSYELLNEYMAEEIFIENKCIMGVKLKNKITEMKMGVYIVYIPPEGSIYSNNTEGVYDELLLQVYATVNWDKFIVMGDFNARVGDLKDCCDIDNLMDRQTIDNTINNHGRELIDFLIESKCCIVNG